MGAEWLEKLFLQILQMSLWGAYCVVAVMVLRLLLKRQPKIFSYLLWLIVAFRLICPISFESQFSGFQLADRKIATSQGVQKVQQIEGMEIRDDERITLSEGSTLKTEVVKPIVTEQKTVESRPLSINAWMVGSVIWVIGISGMLLYMLWSTLKLKKRLKTAVEKKDYYEIEGIESPFVFGIIRPRIYFPTNIEGNEIIYILEHERTHIRRKDYLIKPAAFLILSIHWFNPLAWVAFSCMTKDMEMSCDEAVLKRKGKDIKQSYSTSLLFLASKEKFIGAGPLAFGETGVKSRVKNILNYKKPGFRGIMAAVVLLLSAGLVLMSDPKKPEEKDKEEIEAETQSAASGIDKENTQEWGVGISLPENESWISDIVYNTEDRDRIQIEYYDNIAEAKMTLRVGKEEPLELSGIVETFDESREETWGGTTAQDEWIDVRVQYTMLNDEQRKILVSWKYNGNTYVIFGEVSENIDTLPIAKTALHIIARIGYIEEGLPVYNMSEQKQAEELLQSYGELKYQEIEEGNVDTRNMIVVDLFGNISNLERWFTFVENSRAYNEDAVVVAGYTKEGDAILNYVSYKNDTYYELRDTTRDEFGAQGYEQAQIPYLKEYADDGRIHYYLTEEDLTLEEIKEYMLSGSNIREEHYFSEVMNIPYEVLEQVQGTEAVENAKAKDLEYCITKAILSADAGKPESGEFQTEAHHNLKIAEESGKVTVYTHVLCQGWKNIYETGRGSYIPTAITFTKDENGRYQLEEYWIPKDGGDFKPSIEEKFPEDIWEETWNHQEYIDALEEECKQKAAEYFSR